MGSEHCMTNKANTVYSRLVFHLYWINKTMEEMDLLSRDDNKNRNDSSKDEKKLVTAQGQVEETTSGDAENDSKEKRDKEVKSEKDSDGDFTSLCLFCFYYFLCFHFPH